MNIMQISFDKAASLFDKHRFWDAVPKKAMVKKDTKVSTYNKKTHRNTAIARLFLRPIEIEITMPASAKNPWSVIEKELPHAMMTYGAQGPRSLAIFEDQLKYHKARYVDTPSPSRRESAAAAAIRV